MSDRGGCNWENHPERYCVTDHMVYFNYDEINFCLGFRRNHRHKNTYKLTDDILTVLNIKLLFCGIIGDLEKAF